MEIVPAFQHWLVLQNIGTWPMSSTKIWRIFFTETISYFLHSDICSSISFYKCARELSSLASTNQKTQSENLGPCKLTTTITTFQSNSVPTNYSLSKIALRWTQSAANNLSLHTVQSGSSYNILEKHTASMFRAGVKPQTVHSSETLVHLPDYTISFTVSCIIKICF
jgi:hypothetical protein